MGGPSEPRTEQQVLARFQDLRQAVSSTWSKINDLEAEAAEHELVIKVRAWCGSRWCALTGSTGAYIETGAGRLSAAARCTCKQRQLRCGVKAWCYLGRALRSFHCGMGMLIAHTGID